ncbi:dedicator of cytokinesis protein 9 isoform X1 [Anopheles funestus]|uniref:dedicator of cytokinesis protein 9 isoform X1 n=1 Tax=Anopheles funestus TaxID=62324 RepID=UPI0020C657EE|nr:dedicator of cytokinesis protein 9 isoform X1 [Anopheles funestus]XP_049286748.1 dedicator of cytokinesis protein 9 isoform X1 [Anopheles funestus]XP_049286749.1 dedicator of cytokinesis protein 9 isoform X1 [Anopheles funestus]XP_049286750.1 dedicator of cytokinesis protein 9 isoform X1 [Anopheles funestus]XP_049286751.1 dedicator of cytokinesis protein 9 isoform X1 [Anopheles funestus]XP_049286752.1 dedicator of cytokinesis protein 9 isoform X1 [Anopheles funestus]XP_049286753.1 dedicato
MTERKFTRGLNKPGMAAQLRENISQVVRESTSLTKPIIVEPIDFEAFVLKNRTLIQNDPQRELLLYPNDDVSEILQPKKFRTVHSNIPGHVPKHQSVVTNTNGSSKRGSESGSASSSQNGTPTSNRSQSSVSAGSGVPTVGGLLLTRQALHTYDSPNHLIHYKYSKYGGTCYDLPRISPSEELREEVYEVDTDPDRLDEQMTRSQADTIAKQGYLFKGPDTNSDRMFAHIGSKSFKKRYCYLRQEIDGTYILELHKDEKQAEAKATIVMDFCTEVVPNPKKGRFCFELKMKMNEGQHGKSVTLAADDESEMEDWLRKISSVLQQNKLQEDKRVASLERAAAPLLPASPSTMQYGTLKGLEQSMNPQLNRYARETDQSIAQARRDNRKRLFGGQQLLYLQSGGNIGGGMKANSTSGGITPGLSKSEAFIEPYRAQFGQRILIKCDSLRFRLLGPIDGVHGPPAQDSEAPLCQIEPYLTSVALYDARTGRKLSENFYFDLNKDHVQELLTGSCRAERPLCASPKATNKSHQNGHGTLKPARAKCDTSDELHLHSEAVTKEWMSRAKQAVFNVTVPHADIFIVVRIDKILQGAINPSVEPYLKTTKDPKVLCKLQKAIKQYAQKCGHYRMPFAWAARPLFQLYSNDLDTSYEFPAIYRQEGTKLKDEELLKLLSEYRKPDKFSKLTVIPGSLKIYIEALNELPNNCLTNSLVPLNPFPIPPVADPTLEVTEFANSSDQYLHPFVHFVNHLFVYPLHLNYDSQKIFSRARNLAVIVELRDSDTAEAKSIECIYGRPGQDQLVSQMSCPVLHHNTSPTWYEEIKLRLPLNITSQHHLLFSFFHVSCNIAKKKDLTTISTETPVGFAWLPLLTKGKINVEEQCLPVAATLPVGYLSIQPLGLGKGQNAGPDVQWIDNQRPIFTISLRLDSTVLTTDQHLHNLFLHAERLLEHSKTVAPPDTTETCKILKAAHAIQIGSLITFLPTILNQLFSLLVATNSEEVGLNIIRLLVNLFHMVAEEAKRKELLMAYVKYVYRIDSQPVNGSSPTSQSVNTVHGELCRHLPTLLHPNNTDFLLVNKFMKFSGIFFEVIVKSMAQYLLSTGRIKMQRNERFPKEFCTRIEALFQVLVPYINSRHKDLPMETEQLNQSLSVFVKRCLSFMDRGFVFRLIRLYMDRWGPGDSRILQEYKFSFLREVCAHEHYVPLNLPFMLTPNNRAPDLLQQFCLSEEYCRQHFLVGILLQEVKSSLNEVSHIRRMGLVTLKELLAKHDLDDRYQNKGQLSRLAMLYVPWLGIVLENLNRISDGMERKGKHVTVGTNRMSCSSSYVFARDSLSTLPTATPSTVTSQTSTPKSRSNRVTMFMEYTSPIRSSLHLKDTSFLAAIAGQSAGLSNGHSSSSLNSECSTLSQDGTVVIRNQFNESYANSARPSHARSVSVTQPTIIQRTDKFSVSETKDLLISFLFVVKHLSPEHMIAWWHNCTESETVQFFTVLDLCLLYFRYVGKKHIHVPAEGGRDTKSSKAAKASTLPARVLPPSITNGSESGFESGTLNHTANRENLVEETLRLKQALYESNLATEIGLIVLDCMGLYSVQFRDSMIEGTVLPKIARVYLRFLQLGQSESLSKHVFAALRAFINNFSQALFKGTAVLCGQLVYELLKCCDSRLSSLRQEACAVLYLLMRSNFEFSGRKGLTRVHLQVIISVSQMIGNVIGLNNARFQESLSTINNYASSDKAMKGTGFPMEVKDLTRRVRTVLMATAQMQAHHMDPERLLELQHSLANSYASTPELRQTWLTTMANNHLQNGNISEAACCYLHIAALVSEYLKLKGCCAVAQGAESFARISRNIPRDEKGLKLDSGTQDSQYTEQFLLERLKECAEYLDRSERLECLGELYRLIIPILESRRDYHGLTQCYEHLTQAYNRVIEFNKSGKRLLGRFYRVIFFSQVYFEEENGVEYIYKEPKVTSLSEISERLHKQYRDKFGADNVKILMDSAPVDQSTLDPKIAYIQVTHVTPYYCKDELEMRPTEFEQNHDVDTFMYETPFTPSGSAHGVVEDQWKRRTVLTTLHSFPYVLKRIPVRDRQSQELSPIEVAIDEMQTKIAELEEIVMGPIDLKKLQLRLQGSVAVTVNAGPLAYASAFLDPTKPCIKKYSLEKVEELKEVFRDFIKICYTVLQINANLISSDQREYHNALKENYENLCSALSDLLGEIVYPLDDGNNNAHRHSLALFSAISGAPTNSSTA